MTDVGGRKLGITGRCTGVCQAAAVSDTVVAVKDGGATDNTFVGGMKTDDGCGKADVGITKADVGGKKVDVGSAKVCAGGRWPSAGSVGNLVENVVSAMVGLSVLTPADSVDTLPPLTAGTAATLLFVGRASADNRQTTSNQHTSHTQPITYPQYYTVSQKNLHPKGRST